MSSKKIPSIVDLKTASSLLEQHIPVAMPTETVYGLAAKFNDIEAIKKIFEQKKRPSDNPLIIHISSLSQLDVLIDQKITPFKPLIKQFWPGPLSLVFKANISSVPSIVRAGLDTVAVRMPNHPIALQLIEQCGPLVAPSANISGYPSPTRAEHILRDYNEKVHVIDGGPSQAGLESSVLAVYNPEQIHWLRPGPIGNYDLRKFGIELNTELNQSVHSNEEQKHSPGMRYRHYAPYAKVVWIDHLNEVDQTKKSMILSLEPLAKGSKNKAHITYTFENDAEAFAKQLYHCLREADEHALEIVYILKMQESSNDDAIKKALLNRINKAISRE